MKLANFGLVVLLFARLVLTRKVADRSSSLADDIGDWRSLSPVMSRLGPNVCYVQQGPDGCRFRVTVLADECGYEKDANLRSGIGKRELGEREYHASLKDPNSLQKLEAVEQKLVRMMEDLSVRSLRHIREIRSDLRQMSDTMNLLKNGNGVESSTYEGRHFSRHQPPRKCPPEFTAVGVWTSCYRFSNFEATWTEAREYCNVFGANLLSLESIKEAYIIDYLIKSNQEFQEPKGWWTGGSYSVRGQRWTWSSGLEKHHQQQLQPLNFSRWVEGSPSSNPRSAANHCLVLLKPYRYHWLDASCMDRYNFICQVEST